MGCLKLKYQDKRFYPFGMEMMNYVNEEFAGYRYGFQSQEGDDEIKGSGNSWNYTYRMHDARLGRFFAVDPLVRKYPYNSPYAFSENRIMDGIELEGLEWEPVNSDGEKVPVDSKDIADYKWVGYETKVNFDVNKGFYITEVAPEGTVENATLRTGKFSMKFYETTTPTKFVELDHKVTEETITDKKTIRKINSLHSDVQGPVSEFILNLNHYTGKIWRVNEGYRTYAEQDALYNRHNGTTNARGGYSNHNFGLAIDIIPIQGLYSWWEKKENRELRLAIGEYAESLGFEWGGRWVKQKTRNQLRKKHGTEIGNQMIEELISNGLGWDPAHFQLLFGNTLKDLRKTEKDADGLPILK